MPDLDISHNLAQFDALMAQHAADLPQIIREATSAATWRIYAYSRRLLKDSVYNKPIPRWKNGNPQWRRSYALLKAERVSMGGVGLENVFGIVDTDPSSPAAKYAAARHNLDRGNKRTGTPARIARWRDEAVKQGQSAAGRDFRKVLRERLGDSASNRRLVNS